jgi:hypothetical protein
VRKNLNDLRENGLFATTLEEFFECYLVVRPGKYGSALELARHLGTNMSKESHAGGETLNKVKSTLERLAKQHADVEGPELETDEVLRATVNGMDNGPSQYLGYILVVTGVRGANLFYLRFCQVHIVGTDMIILWTYLKAGPSRKYVIFAKYPLRGFPVPAGMVQWLDEQRRANRLKTLVSIIKKNRVNTFRTSLMELMNASWVKVAARNPKIKKLSIKDPRRAADAGFRNLDGLTDAQVDILMNHTADTADTHYGGAHLKLIKASGQVVEGVTVLSDGEETLNFPTAIDEEDSFADATDPSLEELQAVQVTA